MTTQAAVQAKVFYGYGVAARNLGSPYQQFRATSATNPLAGPPIGTVQAAFDADPKFSFKAPSSYAKPVFYGLFDGTLVHVGDYLVGGMGTFFYAGYEPVKPPLCVQCNRTISFTRPTEPAGSGTGYGGRQTGTSNPTIASGWPASVLQGTKGESNPTGLPSDVRAPWVTILLPAIPGVTLQYGDAASDDLGRGFVLSNVELTELGYRISATYAGA